MLLLKILLAILAFNVIIVAHEWGHLFMARRFRVPVEAFSIGFGPALLKWHRGGIRYQLAPIPLGGYVKFQETPGQTMSPGLYGRTSPLGTLAVTMGGVIVNFILGFTSLTIALWINGHGVLGAPIRALQGMWMALHLTFTKLPEAFSSTFSNPSAGEGFSGPVGIVDVTVTYSNDLASAIALFGLVSLAIGITNLLPLPILDGGQCLLGLLQHAMRRPLAPFVITGLTFVSLAVMLAIFTFGTWGDLLNLGQR